MAWLFSAVGNRAVYVVVISTVLLLSRSAIVQSGDNAAASIQQRLEERVAADSGNASNWRLLGRMQAKNGDLAEARRSLDTAAELEPNSPATQFDLAALAFELAQYESATRYALRCIELGPDTKYAADAQAMLSDIDSTTASESAVQQIDHEITRFDGSALGPEPDDVFAPQSPWRVRLETGVVYNSNVTLTPINRELFPAESDSAQLFAAPELEYRALDTAEWGAGPSFLGHFTVNEDEFRNLNLQSYQPGGFLERVFLNGSKVQVARLQYGFTHDEFDGRTLGNRHSVMASTATVWDCKDLSFAYASADHTDILNDGAQPGVTGRDGWTYRLGAAHTFAVDHRWLESIRFGIDGEHAELSGSSFRYRGVSLHTLLQVPITDSIKLQAEGGWGYRDYFDFDTNTAPSRNENIWRAGFRLTKQINDHWSIAGTFNFDRFDSKNALFAADRFLSGVVAIVEY